MTHTAISPNSCCDTTPATRASAEPVYSPRIDVWENDDEVVLYADLPGVAPEDLDIRVEDRELTIRAKVASRRQRAAMLHSEYGWGDFYRAFTLTESIDEAKISAELKRGVLTLRLPKSEAVKPRRIPIAS